MIRLEFALRRKPGMSRADFQQYWRDEHGPLVARHSTTLGIHRYIQLSARTLALPRVSTYRAVRRCGAVGVSRWPVERAYRTVAINCQLFGGTYPVKG